MISRTVTLVLLASIVAAGLLAGCARAGTVLSIDPECRNAGSVSTPTERWSVAEPLPVEWRGRAEVSGRLAVADDQTFFEADGQRVLITQDATTTECVPWDQPVLADDGPDPESP